MVQAEINLLEERLAVLRGQLPSEATTQNDSLSEFPAVNRSINSLVYSDDEFANFNNHDSDAVSGFGSDDDEPNSNYSSFTDFSLEEEI